MVVTTMLALDEEDDDDLFLLSSINHQAPLEDIVEEYLEIAQHPSDEHDLSFESAHPSMETACAQVHEILKQVISIDYPPPYNSRAKGSAAGQSDGGSESAVETHQSSVDSHEHDQEIGPATSDEDSSSFGVTAFLNDYDVPPEQRRPLLSSPRYPATQSVSPECSALAHDALVALSSWSLEQTEGIPPNLNHYTKPPHQQPQVITTTPTPKHGGGEFFKSSSTSKKKGFWNKVSGSKVDEKKEETPGEATTTTVSTTAKIPRRQMYASEYARHMVEQQNLPPEQQLQQQPSTPRKAAKLSTFFKSTPSRNATSSNRYALEEADAATQAGAVLDITVTLGDAPPPPGYYRLTQTCGSGHDLSSLLRHKKSAVHLNVKKEPSWDKAAQRPTITAVSLIFPDRPGGQEFVPPGFCVAKSVDTKEPANLSASDTERCFLVFRRSREGNPVTGLIALAPPEPVPAGYTVVERTPRNHVANLNACKQGAGGLPLFLAYRQRLASLEALRPMPLLQTVHHPSGTAATDSDASDCDSITGAPRLRAYYATGGTTVQARVGCFHLLDRSTHTLLSPSSVANRLKLIEISRRKAAAGNDDSTGGGHGGDPDDSFTTTPQNSTADYHNTSLSSQDGEIPSYILSRPYHEAWRGAIAIMVHDVQTQHAMEALAFIPRVETAITGTEKTRALVHLHARTLVLTPLLTACYNVHGQGGLKAVEGLYRILTQSTFFEDDVASGGDDESSARLTLLDLTIQTVCDFCTMSAMETTFTTCVEFVEAAVRYAQGQLNTRTVGYVLRFYLFTFYFGASVPSALYAPWPNPSWQLRKCKPGEDIALLYDPREQQECGYLPSSQTAALALKELISLSIVRLGKVSVNHHEGMSVAPEEDFFGGILNTIMENAVDHVDRANYTQLAFYQIHRSGGSELFWHDMTNLCGLGLFGNDSTLCEAGREIYITIFAIMANLVKVTTGSTKASSRKTEHPRVSRDVGSKLLSFELLLHFLEYWSDEQEAVGGVKEQQPDSKSVDMLSFCVRRMVVPALLSNTRCGLEDAQIFRRMLRILSELWCSPLYRKHCKMELGMLIEHFALKMLQLGPQLVPQTHVDLSSSTAHISLLIQQVEVIREIKNWFLDNPKDVIEIFLNFDTDLCSEITGPIQLLPGTQWKIFQRLCAGLANIAEQCGELIGDQVRQNQTKLMSNSKTSAAVPDGLASMVEALHKSNEYSVDKKAARQAAKILRKTSLETISQIVKSLAVSAAASAGCQFTELLVSWAGPDGGSVAIAVEQTSSGSEQKVEVSIASDQQPEPQQEEEEPPDVKRRIGKLKPTSANDAGSILNYWRSAIATEHQERLSGAAVPTGEESLQVALEISSRKSIKKAVEYLIACNSLSPAPRDVANFLRIHQDQLDPTDLGNYLSSGGGPEAEYWASIRHLYVRAVSFVGSHVEEGLRHFLTHCGFLLPGEAQRIDRMIHTFSICYYQDNAGDYIKCPFSSEDTVYVLAFAMIMLNTDLHKSGTSKRKKMTKQDFINNLRGTDGGTDIQKEYLSEVFDSIQANPIVMQASECVAGSASEERTKTLNDMLSNVRGADSLLRGLAVHDFHFATIQDFVSGLDYNINDALGDLTRSCVSKTWHQWHGVICTGLETAHLDPHGMEPNIEILLYALTLTVCLDMPTERAAFLGQLGRLKAFEDRRQGQVVAGPDYDSRKEPWYVEIEQACRGPTSSKVWALQKIFDWMQSLKSALAVDVENKTRMQEAVKELKDSDFLLQDPVRCFCMAGNLTKKSKTHGGTKQYRFYLFSDVFLYASEEPDGRYKIHEEFPLHLMKIVDWYPPSKKDRNIMFEVHHPRKSFSVVCSSSKERKAWVKSIKAAIAVEMDRKMKVEAARISVYTR